MLCGKDDNTVISQVKSTLPVRPDPSTSGKRYPAARSTCAATQRIEMKLPLGALHVFAKNTDSIASCHACDRITVFPRRMDCLLLRPPCLQIKIVKVCQNQRSNFSSWAYTGSCMPTLPFQRSIVYKRCANRNWKLNETELYHLYSQISIF